MATFQELQKTSDSPSQVRKAVAAIAFLAPYSADPIESLTETTGELKAIPTGFKPVGLVTTDGYSFGGDTNTEEVEALGYAAPVRSDITSVSRSVSFTAYEVMRKEILSLAYSMDLSTVEQATSGEIKIERPTLPAKQYWRLVVIAKDGSGADEIYRAKFFPRVSITSIPEEAWGQDAMSFEVELAAEVDDELGTNEIDFIAGPGAAKDKLALGFKQTA